MSSSIRFQDRVRAPVKSAPRRRVLRQKDIPVPKKISDEDFDALCATCRILASPRKHDTKGRLDELVDHLCDWMSDRRRQPDPQSDRRRLEKALKYIRQTAGQIEQLSPSGHFALKASSPFLAPMLAAQWMNERFLNDDYVPRRLAVPPAGTRMPARESLRAPKYFIEESSHEARLRFVHRYPGKTTSAALKEIERGLAEGIRALHLQPGSRGGRKRLTFRHFLLVNLANMWTETLGRQVSTGPGSEFAGFCEIVVVSIGWPTDGLSSAVPAAIEDWRNRRGKSAR